MDAYIELRIGEDFHSGECVFHVYTVEDGMELWFSTNLNLDQACFNVRRICGYHEYGHCFVKDKMGNIIRTILNPALIDNDGWDQIRGFLARVYMPTHIPALSYDAEFCPTKEDSLVDLLKLIPM